jgi:hypothetical protein
MSRQSKTTSSAQLRRSPAAGDAPVRTPASPTYAQIAARAYELFLAHGAEHGRDQEDWYQAERELRLGKQ